jgi:DTW domain-containing protein YfiP
VGGKRSHNSVRCIGCRMHLALCICDAIPRIRSRVRWVFVVHPSERWKTTHTGRIAAQGLVDASVCFWVGRVSPFEPAPDPGAPGAAAVLFPPLPNESPAIPAGEWACAIEKRGLRPVVFVPDGTWGQCRKMVRRHERFQGMPRISLPEEARPRGGLRLECLRGGMSTIDAVAWLLEAVDGAQAAEPMSRVHRMMWERTMVSRGRPLPGGPTMDDLI